MARDPPPLDIGSSPNTRDLNLVPTAVVKARPTIIHPQLRDLILPLEQGRVLYPRGPRVEELTWTHENVGDDEGVEKSDGGGKKIIRESAKTLYALTFTPNCLVATKNIIAAGGQHGELYITNLPPPRDISSTAKKLIERFPPSRLRPFTLAMSLGSQRSINNSMILLPSFPGEWERQSRERRIGYRHYDHQSGFDPEEEDEGDEEEEEERQEKGREEDDEAMDLDEEEEEDAFDEEIMPSSPLTYPNTVPFLHPPRIPTASSSTSSALGPGPSRRSVSFSSQLRPPEHGSSQPTRLARQSFSIPRPGTGMPPIEYVTSRALPRPNPSTFASTSSARLRNRPPLVSHRSKGSKQKFDTTIIDAPRLLISNNDLTVKMYSLPVVPEDPRQPPRPQSRSNEVHETLSPFSYGQRPPVWTSYIGQSPPSGGRAVPIPIPRFGTRYNSNLDNPTPSAAYENDEEGTADPRRRVYTDLSRPSSERARQAFERQRVDFERLVGMPLGPMAHERDQEVNVVYNPARVRDASAPADREERRIARIGGSKFKCAINHSSLSPDLRNMVSVGDSNEVHLFEVVGGGIEFRKVATYTAATDSGFSTAWSRDGRKFAVASQDGQVTVWDHRSSKPLAEFFTSQGQSRTPSSPSFSSDLLSAMSHTYASGSDLGTGYPFLRDAARAPMLVDPVTGDTRSGASTSGREAARVVKFSPEGAPRDLLVFSEENSNIHVIDALTLTSHIVLPVPYDHAPPPRHGYTGTSPTSGPRAGLEGGQWGIAGVAFDPTGRWLYSGTERTVVEWDMGGEPQGQGVWVMA